MDIFDQYLSDKNSIFASDYTILECVGQGGMGLIFKARQHSLDRIVAIKAIRPELTDSEEYVNIIKREARIAASLSHPNIVHIHSTGCDRGVFFFVMQYIEGKDLEHHLSEARARAGEAKKSLFDIRTVVKIARVLFEALEHAHSKGVIHGDIKPSNIILAKDKTPYISDLGIARLKTAAKSVMNFSGTPLYMAPEAHTGFVDHRADIYSLGIVLYELLTLRHPHDSLQALSGVSQGSYAQVPAGEANPEVPERLSGIIQKCMSEKIELRYASCRLVLRDLEDPRVLFNPVVVSKRQSQSGNVSRGKNGKEDSAAIIKTAAGVVLKTALVFFVCVAVLYGVKLYMDAKRNYSQKKEAGLFDTRTILKIEIADNYAFVNMPNRAKNVMQNLMKQAFGSDQKKYLKLLNDRICDLTRAAGNESG